jgi:hypothetical protein
MGQLSEVVLLIQSCGYLATSTPVWDKLLAVRCATSSPMPYLFTLYQAPLDYQTVWYPLRPKFNRQLPTIQFHDLLPIDQKSEVMSGAHEATECRKFDTQSSPECIRVPSSCTFGLVHAYIDLLRVL